MTTVKIGAQTVNIDDPCALYNALYAVKLNRLAGQAVEETMVKSPVTQRQIKVASVSMADLEAELAVLKSACERKNGRAARRAITFG